MLCVIDSIGLRDEVQGNRFKKANTPTFDEFFKSYPNSIIQVSG